MRVWQNLNVMIEVYLECSDASLDSAVTRIIDVATTPRPLGKKEVEEAVRECSDFFCGYQFDLVGALNVAFPIPESDEEIMDAMEEKDALGKVEEAETS